MDIEEYSTACSAAAEVVRRVVTALDVSPGLVLGLPTGKTFEPVYRGLVAACRDGAVSFSKARSFNLDEYVGPPCGSTGTFAHYMATRFVEHVDLEPGHFHIPSSDPRDADKRAKAYEAMISDAGGLDLLLLGLGRNGHIGFNEPGSKHDSLTRVVTLSPLTRRANKDAFPPGVQTPERAITMGIRTILGARRILLLATGEAKAEAVRALVCGEITDRVPASYLRLHQDVMLIADRAALSQRVDQI